VLAFLESGWLDIYTSALFAWLISHHPAVLFSQNKPATSNQPAVLFSQNKSAPAISHQPNEQAVGSIISTPYQLCYVPSCLLIMPHPIPLTASNLCTVCAFVILSTHALPLNLSFVARKHARHDTRIPTLELEWYGTYQSFGVCFSRHATRYSTPKLSTHSWT
jgi:hypothetical protein